MKIQLLKLVRKHRVIDNSTVQPNEECQRPTLIALLPNGQRCNAAPFCTGICINEPYFMIYSTPAFSKIKLSGSLQNSCIQGCGLPTSQVPTNLEENTAPSATSTSCYVANHVLESTYYKVEIKTNYSKQEKLHSLTPSQKSPLFT